MFDSHKHLVGLNGPLSFPRRDRDSEDWDQDQMFVCFFIIHSKTNLTWICIWGIFIKHTQTSPGGFFIHSPDWRYPWPLLLLLLFIHVPDPTHQFGAILTDLLMFVDMLKGMLQLDATQQISPRQVLEHHQLVPHGQLCTLSSQWSILWFHQVL